MLSPLVLNYTYYLLGWVTFAVSGMMQATLLVMCFAWKHRQGKLGIDDFGHPIHDGDERSFEEAEAEGDEHEEETVVFEEVVVTEESPLLVKGSNGKAGDVAWLGWLRS